MVSPKPLKVALLLASLALAGGGIALMSSARNTQVRKLTPIPGVAPDGSIIGESGSGETSKGANAPSVPPAPRPTAPKPKVQPAVEKIPDDIQWRTDFASAMKEARESGKPLMVDFYTDWCGFCKKLDTDVYSDFGIIAESVNFVSIKINAEKSSKLAAKYQVSSFPTIIWLDDHGAPLETLPGYADAPEFLEIMRRVRSKMPSSAV